MSVELLKSSRTTGVPRALVALVAVLISLVAFSGALVELVHRWNAQEEYSHGFLIPVVAAWLLWRRREAMLASIGQPSWAGPVLIFFALGVHVIGELSALFIFSQLGFVVALIGIALSLGGYSLLRVTFVPIVFLLFAIPLPYFIDAALTLRLQFISSELGTLFIQLFQIPVYLEGNIIDLGWYKLQVVEACSGLRYLYPLLSIGFLAAYLFQAPLWQRAVVFLSTIPITIIMNGFRIGIVGVTVDRWGIEMADEALHFFEGWIIFLACSGLLAGEVFLFARFSGKAMFEVFDLPNVKASLNGGSKIERAATLLPMFVSLVLLFAGAAAVASISGRSEIVPQRVRFASFPSRIGQWQGHASLLAPGTEQGLGVDDYILSDYSRSDGKSVNLYVAYYASQRSGESPHSPVVCIPGGGWLITKLDRARYAELGTEVPFNRVVIEKDSIKELVYYWFDERGRKIANEYWSKWYLLTDAIIKNRTDGSLVRLSTQISAEESEHDADERLRSFMGDVLPSLTQYLPSDGAGEVKSVASTPAGHHS
jgi:exosortase D (VPLPA-CTERM-specific)